MQYRADWHELMAEDPSISRVCAPNCDPQTHKHAADLALAEEAWFAQFTASGETGKRRDLFPLRHVGAHCGEPYLGGRYSRAQGGGRAYVHDRPGVNQPKTLSRFAEEGS